VTGAAVAVISRDRSGPLRCPTFRRFFAALSISNVGTFAQSIAFSVVVLTLAAGAANGALFLGIVAACRSVPVILLFPLAGSIVDRYDARRVLVLAHTVFAAQSLVMCVLVALHRIDLPAAVALAMVAGAASIFEAPARNTWVAELVDADRLVSANGYQSLAVSVPMLVGPLVGSWSIVRFGTSAAFAVNVVATSVLIVTIARSGASAARAPRPARPVLSLAGVRAVLRDSREVRLLLLASAIAALCLRPVDYILPSLAAALSRLDPVLIGVTESALGLGYVVGSVVLARMRLGSRRYRTLAALAVGYAALVAGVGAARGVPAFLALVLLFGAALSLFSGYLLSLLQNAVRPEIRGSAMSFAALFAMGLPPGGALVLGWTVRLDGSGAALGADAALAAALLVALGAAAWYRAPGRSEFFHRRTIR
jgi:transmembrane secretion effector